MSDIYVRRECNFFCHSPIQGTAYLFLKIQVEVSNKQHGLCKAGCYPRPCIDYPKYLNLFGMNGLTRGAICV